MTSKAQFGAALSRRIADRGLTAAALSRITGIHDSQLGNYRHGRTMPEPEQMARIAVALEAPGLVEMYDEVLARECDYCGRRFRKHPRANMRHRFCTTRCKEHWQIDVGKQRRLVARPDVIEHLRSRLSGKENRISDLLAERATYSEAVSAFCRSCEWDGICKAPGCELRPVSPLPLARERVA